jgi:hypothetical protein
MDELGPRLSQLRQVGDDRGVGLDQIPVAAATWAGAALILLRDAGHRQVCPDSGERVERRSLRVVETVREAEIVITSPTPSANPSSVTIVRPFRRRSSARR